MVTRRLTTYWKNGLIFSSIKRFSYFALFGTPTKYYQQPAIVKPCQTANQHVCIPTRLRISRHSRVHVIHGWHGSRDALSLRIPGTLDIGVETTLTLYGGFHKWGIPKLVVWFIREYPFKMDDFGVPSKATYIISHYIPIWSFDMPKVTDGMCRNPSQMPPNVELELILRCKCATQTLDKYRYPLVI